MNPKGILKEVPKANPKGSPISDIKESRISAIFICLWGGGGGGTGGPS